VSVYLAGDVLEQCRDLLQRGERLENLAVRLRVCPDDLAALLRLHHQPRGRAAADSGEVDLWASAEGVL
jgi:hypothetical protein